MPSKISLSRAESLFAGMRIVVPSGSLDRSTSELSFLMSFTLKPVDGWVCTGWAMAGDATVVQVLPYPACWRCCLLCHPFELYMVVHQYQHVQPSFFDEEPVCFGADMVVVMH